MTPQKFRSTIATSLRAFGYLMCLLGWLWVVVIGVPPLIENGNLDLIIPSEPAPARPVPSEPQSGLSPLASLSVSLITLLMLAVTFFVLWRLPRTVVKQGDKLVESTTDVVLPVVTHHKKLPVKQKRILSRRFALAIQVTVTILPLAIIIFLPAPAILTRDIIMTTGAILAGAGLFFFGLSYVVDVPPTTPATTSRTRSRASRG